MTSASYLHPVTALLSISLYFLSFMYTKLLTKSILCCQQLKNTSFWAFPCVEAESQSPKVLQNEHKHGTEDQHTQPFGKKMPVISLRFCYSFRNTKLTRSRHCNSSTVLKKAQTKTRRQTPRQHNRTGENWKKKTSKVRLPVAPLAGSGGRTATLRPPSQTARHFPFLADQNNFISANFIIPSP